MSRQMVEREYELSVLAAAARDAASGAGSVVLIWGEAGIGKSSLVEALRSALPAEGRLLVGYCDDLATPRTLGPLRDLIGKIGPGLTRALDGGDRTRIMDALRAELDWLGQPTVLVIEDVHWADEATLDALRYLVRRLARLPAVLVLTYRDDELSREHPLQQLLGLASRSERVHRLPLSRLSEMAVRRLGAAGPLDPAEVFAVTSGNPYFVAEVLTFGDTVTVPPTIADAVLARIGRLDSDTQELLEQLAVVPSAVERWLVDALVPGGLDRLAEAEQFGLLTVTAARVAFRHELTRRVIVDSMPAGRRVQRNQRVLAALIDHPGADLSRIIHHAAVAGDNGAIVRHGPGAAREAAHASSHREAAAHYRLILGLRSRFTPAAQADLLEQYAVECYTLGDADTAVRTQQEAIALLRALGDQRLLGTALRWLSRMHWWAGDPEPADRAGAEAVAVLEQAADTGLLAMALSNLSQLHFLRGRSAESIAIGERAVAMARAGDDGGVLSHALNNVGSARWLHGDPTGGRDVLLESLGVALAAGEAEQTCRAYVNLIWNHLDDLELAAAEQYVGPAIAFAEDVEQVGFLQYLHVEEGMLRLATGDWDEAVRAAEQAVEAPPSVRCPALRLLGLVSVRRGLPDADALLTQAWELAVRLIEPQRVGPVAAARAEAAWLRGDLAEVAGAVEAVWADISRFGTAAQRAELRYWLFKSGRPTPAPGPRDIPDHPFELQAAGRWQEAADAWKRLGYPYEYAAALADSSDPDALLAALAELDALGAEPLARQVRLRLRELGSIRVPRGPVDTTRRNPAGLTARQLQVVRLLGKGMSNADIAERLVLSVRTIDHHVAAVLDKLGVENRRDASARAEELGVLGDR